MEILVDFLIWGIHDGKYICNAFKKEEAPAYEIVRRYSEGLKLSFGWFIFIVDKNVERAKSN